VRAHRFTGVGAWWVQRVSAVCILAFMVFALGSFWLHPPADYADWHRRFERPWLQAATLAFAAALLAHAWVGLRDVLLDYARPVALRRFLVAAVAVALVALGLWMLAIVRAVGA
jgi:succinate dehydrogenase / fumarate reductase membrane anchor subunit